MRKILVLTAAALLFAESAWAQSADPARAETVTWTASVSPASSKPSATLKLNLAAKVAEGWHVYALKQLPNGPTPLRISIDANPLAAQAGEPMASPATKVHDPAFDLDTPLYSKAFTASVPLTLAAHARAGNGTIPVTVRFQTCNGKICQPPKTVHLSAPITIQ